MFTNQDEKKPQNDNFYLKEAVCSVMDVLSCFRLKVDSEIDLKCGILPNEVNGNYLKFKVTLYTLLEHLIQISCSPPGTSTVSQELPSEHENRVKNNILIDLDFEKIVEQYAPTRRYVYSIKMNHLIFDDAEVALI